MYAERNRNLKKVFEQAFGKGNVKVHGSRGTAYGWVTVNICYAPRNIREASELRTQAFALINAAKIHIGTYGYDDPGSDYGFGSKIHINFAQCREQADYYGPDRWKHELSASDWDALQQQEVAA
jgi:hypothetical protein